MPNRKPKVPSYRLHKPSGQAVVTLDGRDHYLGPFHDRQSRAEYDRLVAVWLHNGRRLPPVATEEPVAATVNELILMYVRYAEEHYATRRTTADIMRHIKAAMSPLRKLFGPEPAEAFTPLKLEALRRAYVAEGWTLGTVNDRVKIIKRAFSRAVVEGLVRPDVSKALEEVKNLRRGETSARGPRKVRAVPEEHIAAVLPHVTPPVRAMIELQNCTGMRPTETCIMRGCDLDMTGELWIYRPAFHKTEHLDIEREVTLGPKAKEIIKPFLRKNLEEYLFQPAEAVEADRTKRRQNRKTPLWPSHLARYRRRRKQRPAVQRDRYTVDVYRRAIERACRQAWLHPEEVALLAQTPEKRRYKVRAQWRRANRAKLTAWNREHTWTPHQLRHTCGTRIRREFGVEASRIVLGHQHVAATEIYAERDTAVAKTVMAKLG